MLRPICSVAIINREAQTLILIHGGVRTKTIEEAGPQEAEAKEVVVTIVPFVKYAGRPVTLRHTTTLSSISLIWALHLRALTQTISLVTMHR